MATFSISDAFGAGFRLIGRKPGVVLAWGLAYLVLALAPVVAMFVWLAPDFPGLMREIAASASAGPDARAHMMMSGAFLQFQSKAVLLNPVLFLTSLVSRAVLFGAIFRAVLEPEKSAFAYLRLGAQELWLGLLMLAMGILAVILVILLLIPVGVVFGGAIMAIKAAHASTGWTALAACAGVIVYLVLLVWIGLRFSLAAPMTFAEREFRLFESWSLTKGHAWKLFGLGLLLCVVLIAIGMVLDVIFIGGLMAALGLTHFDPTAFAHAFERPPSVWMGALAPWLAAVAVIGSFVGAAIFAIAVAPWAVVYRELAVPRSVPPSLIDPDEHGLEGHA